MKKLLPLFSCLLFIGCGEKSSSEGSQSTGENPTPSNDSAEPSVDVEKPPPVESAVAESPSGEPSESPNSLSDADVERLLKEAVDFDSLEERDGLCYHNNEPYSGWAKGMYDSGQVEGLTQFKDGKPDGLQTWWHVNGQKAYEETFKDGKQNGLMTEYYENGQKSYESTVKDGVFVLEMRWHENGNKHMEGPYKDGQAHGLWTLWRENGQKIRQGESKDGELIWEKFWNSKGEEVETAREAGK